MAKFDLDDYLDSNVTLVTGTSGNDSFLSCAGDDFEVTVNPGKGNDTIYHGPFIDMIYSEGDGNDVISNYTPFGTLHLTSGQVNSTQVSGNDIVLKIGSGSVTFKDLTGISRNSIRPVRVEKPNGDVVVYYDSSRLQKGFNKVIVNGNANKRLNGSRTGDLIYNILGNDVSINSGAGNDLIYNFSSNNGGEYVKIDTGAGNDTVFCYYLGGFSFPDGIFNFASVSTGDGDDYIYGNYFETLDGGRGNDTIFGGMHDLIFGGEGNDYIKGAYAGPMTICGGKDDDEIDFKSTIPSNNNNTVVYYNGDGNDTIYGFQETNKLIIVSDSYSTEVSGNDVMVKVGTDSIIIKDFNGNKFDISKKNAADLSLEVIEYTNRLGGTLVKGTRNKDHITNYGLNASVDGGAGDDTIINIYSSWYEFGAHNSSISAGDGSDYIDDNADNTTIDAGDDYIKKMGKETSILAGAGNDSIFIDDTNSYYSDYLTVNPHPTKSRVLPVVLINRTACLSYGLPSVA